MKDVRYLVTRGAGKPAHVFDDAKDRHLDLLHHPNAASGDFQADILWRADDNSAGQRKALRQRQLCVARAGGQIEDQIVELAPIHF